MSSCKPVTTSISESALRDIEAEDESLADRPRYQVFLGCLLFLETRTSPEIAASVSILCR